jgi:hypothetical protein
MVVISDARLLLLWAEGVPASESLYWFAKALKQVLRWSGSFGEGAKDG